MDDGMDEETTSEQAEAEYQAYLDFTGDSDERLRNIDIEFTLDGDPEGEEVQEGSPIQRISAARIVNVMSYHGLRPFFRHSRISDDVDDGSGHFGYASRHPRREQFAKVPNEAGRELMGSGDFGSNSHYVDELKKRKKALATRLMWRELGIDVNGPRTRATQSISQDLIPRSVADKIIHYDSRCYSGQFSDDGNFFYSCAQNFKVRLYDTSNPHEWKYYKTVEYPFGQWTITDCTLSPDNRFLAYTSIRNLVCLAPTDPAVQSDPTILNLSVPPGGRREEEPYRGSHFAIWSVRFSGDGREIVAGTSQKTVIVYDIETRQSVLRVENHEDDVNAVCFGDNSSPHILYSGSDDTTIRVWDRRSMGDSREAGVFMGHTEGLTYVDSKGDGRYVLSNSKDQTMKLWDLRKMMTTAKFDTIDVNNYTTGFDYRFETYPDDYYEPHPHDCSVVTFRGHRILKTLIRCHFSPPGSTNSRYVYTGSDDGKVYVYNLDATLAGTIDVGMTTLNSRPREPDLLMNAYDFGLRSGELLWRTCVRDASWHPSAPVLAATSWNGWGLSTGTCTLHSWNDCPTEDEGNPPVGLSYDYRLEEEHGFNDYRQTMQAFQRGGPLPRMRHSYISSDEDEDEDENEDESE
ncbi:WD40 repeat domain-containing protein [Aspergillus ruber CBS 135680]|uniref:WD repeat protein n=1 Tax=Aspergillus ruber (strain CBS 135680) TaxID=1388766 RepID=A0A017SIM0_ASPRC|nr:WD repeat protein [Aspergillus ruber CBS 135680]EYE96140.1 WD repeat protein [Aspergillus ruber CBS 135680]